MRALDKNKDKDLTDVSEVGDIFPVPEVVGQQGGDWFIFRDG